MLFQRALLVKAAPRLLQATCHARTATRQVTGQGSALTLRRITTKELLDIATSHASREEAVGAIFDRSDGKMRRDEDASEGASNRPAKRKNKKQRRDNSLTAAVDRKGGWKPAEGTPNHFENQSI